MKMKSITRVAFILSFLMACNISVAPIAHAQEATPAATGNQGTNLIQQMVGVWDVQQRMWAGPGADPIDLPPAVASRRLVGGVFLEEIMTPEDVSGEEPFTRIAYLNYNPVSRRYEYLSLDTRAPQMMTYQGEGSDSAGKGEVRLQGRHFVAPKWGDFTNMTFTYRLTVGQVENGRQVVRLYLTPQSGADTREFLAFGYVYTRRR